MRSWPSARRTGRRSRTTSECPAAGGPRPRRPAQPATRAPSPEPRAHAGRGPRCRCGERDGCDISPAPPATPVTCSARPARDQLPSRARGACDWCGWRGWADVTSVPFATPATWSAASVRSELGARSSELGARSAGRRGRGPPAAGHSEVVRERRPVRRALGQERIAPLDRLVGHVRQPRRLTGEHLLAGESVVGQVERELEHPDGLRGLGRDDPRVLPGQRLDVVVVGDLVDRTPAGGVVGGVLPGEEEDLPRPLLAHLPGEQRGAVAAVEGADVGVGLLEAAVLAAGDGQVGDHVQRVPATRGPAVDDRDDHLGHGADQPLHLQDVQPPRAGGVDRVRGVPLGIPVPVPAPDPLVAAGAERPAAVARARPVAGEQDGPDVGAHPRVVEHPVQLVDRVRAEGVAHLGPVERHPDHGEVPWGAGGPVDAPVVGDVGQVTESVDVPPPRRVERLGHLSGQAGIAPGHGPTLARRLVRRASAVRAERSHARPPSTTVTPVAAPSDVYVYRVPLTVRFRGLAQRDGVLLRGPAGWAEFSPFWDYDVAASLPWWRAAREAADVGWPAPVRDAVPVNVTVPAVDAAAAYAIVAGSGCGTAKVKVAEPGQTVDDEIARLEAVRDAIGPGGRIRIDANGGWDADTAVVRIRWLDRAAGGLEYVEQPCATVPELAAVRRAVHVPIAADESVRLARDPMAVVRAGAADVVVLKVAPLGGVRACLELAERVGLPVVVSSALETSAGLAMAAALPELPYACGLATARLLAADVVTEPLLPVGGMIVVRRPEVDPHLLADHAADRALSARWNARLAAVLAASAEVTG